MIRRPPRSTRTDTLFPYTTLFRSVPHLDRIPAVPGGQQVQNPALEEGRVHAELQGQAPPEPGAQVVDDVAQEGYGLLGVMHVAGAVLQPEDVPGLGHMSETGVVARVLPVMRSDERRVGQEGVRTCGSRWSPAH